jgi:hypothetical protein
MDADETLLRERFIGEMAEGYSDGRKSGNPDPSENRSASYLHGFAKGRAVLARAPGACSWSLRLIDEAIAEDIATAGHRYASKSSWMF